VKEFLKIPEVRNISKETPRRYARMGRKKQEWEDGTAIVQLLTPEHIKRGYRPKTRAFWASAMPFVAARLFIKADAD
jgi:hypothetical protein